MKLFLVWTLSAMLVLSSSFSPAAVTNGDFESGSITGWTVVSGTAFTGSPVVLGADFLGGVAGYEGDYLLSSRENGESATGVLRSNNFTLTSRRVDFAIGGWASRVIADFEGGIDSRGVVMVSDPSIQTTGPFYAWEDPPTPAGDDINYWDVTSDGDGVDEFADYHLLLSPVENLTPYTHVTIRFALTDGNGGTGAHVYTHDASDGYHYLGTFSGTGTVRLPLGPTHLRDEVDDILIRANESDFGGLTTADVTQRTHIYSIVVGWDGGGDNYVALHLADGTELDRQFAPSNNNLLQANLDGGASNIDESVYLEITDGRNDAGYAWLAVDNFTMSDLPTDLDRGHRILIERGLQLQAVGLYTASFDLARWEASNFTTVDFWANPMAPTFLAPAPGASPWCRWTTWWTTTLDFLTAAEQPYEETCVSIHHGDEVDLGDPANVQKIADLLVQLRALYPDTISFHNESAEMSNPTDTQNMMSVALPDIVHAGSYPFGDTHEEYEGGSPTKMYEAFEMYRDLSLAGHDGTGVNPIPYGMFIQTFHNDGRWERAPSTSEITLEQFTAWAFGCKMTNAFLYTANTPVNGGLISTLFTGDGDTTPTTFFDHMAAMNAQSRRLGPALVRLISTEAFIKLGRHDVWWGGSEENDPPSGVPSWNAGADPGHLTGVNAHNPHSDINDGYDGDVVIGYLKALHEDFDGPAAQDEIYFMVVNGLSWGDKTSAECEQTIQLDFDFGSTGITDLQRLNKDTGVVEIVPLIHNGGASYTLVVNMNGGDGDLYKYNTGAPFVGFYQLPEGTSATRTWVRY